MKRKIDVDVENNPKRKKVGSYKYPKANLNECKPGDFFLTRKGTIRKACNKKGRLASHTLCATKDCSRKAIKEGKCLSCNSGRTPKLSLKNQIRPLPENLPIDMVKGRQKYVAMCTTDQRTNGPQSFEQDGRNIETHGFECTKCNEIFPIFLFPFNSMRSFGVQLKCLLCESKRNMLKNMQNSPDWGVKSLTQDDFDKWYNRFENKCAITGWKVDKYDPTAFLSKERFDSDKKYTLDNTTLIRKELNFGGKEAGKMLTSSIINKVCGNVSDTFKEVGPLPKPVPKSKRNIPSDKKLDKTCCYCNEVKNKECHFKKEASAKDGYNPSCKACVKQRTFIETSTPEDYWKYCLKNAKIRANGREKKREPGHARGTMTLKPKHLEKLWKKQKGLCAISKHKMLRQTESWCSASIDRIDNQLGYTEENVRLVIGTLNTKGDAYTKSWSADHFKDFKRAVKEMHGDSVEAKDLIKWPHEE